MENLRRSADWLVIADWNIEQDGLCVDAVIRTHGHDYEVRLLYPDLFPHALPIVRPRNAKGRWSGHQYSGENGVLCLEYRPDNWRPEITGAQMLESAHRLLETEYPLGEIVQKGPSLLRLLTISPWARNSAANGCAGIQVNHCNDFWPSKMSTAAGSVKF